MLNIVEGTRNDAEMLRGCDFISACCPSDPPAAHPAVAGAPVARRRLSATIPPLMIREPKYKERKESMTETIEWFSQFLGGQAFPQKTMLAELATRLNRQLPNVRHCHVRLRMPSGTVDAQSPRLVSRRAPLRHSQTLRFRRYPVGVHGQVYGFIKLGASAKGAISAVDDAQMKVIARLLAVFVYQAHASREMVALTKDYYTEQFYHDIKAQALAARYNAERLLSLIDHPDTTPERLHSLALACRTSLDDIVQRPVPLMALASVDLAHLLAQVVQAVYSSVRAPGCRLDVPPDELNVQAYPDLLKYVLYGLFNTLIDLQLLRVVEGEPVIRLVVLSTPGGQSGGQSWELSIRYRLTDHPEAAPANARLGHLMRWLRRAQSLFSVQGWRATRQQDGDVQIFHTTGLMVTG